DPGTNKISDESPVGRALLGHKVDDTVIVEAPAGEIRLKIVGISK
ncbi:MAG: GreA/GreB family elongation factor, partial [Clostridia bacterium]|nr:GreA/GreB family elongation factor [Clostridia bacterium]